MISRAGKIGEEGRWAHTARHTSEMSAIVDPSYVTSRPVRKLRTESAEKLFMEHLELGTFSALAPPPENLPTSHQHCMGTEVSLILLDHTGSGCTWMRRSRMLAHARKACVAQCMQCSVDAALAEQHAFVALERGKELRHCAKRRGKHCAAAQRGQERPARGLLRCSPARAFHLARRFGSLWGRGRHCKRS